jgi:alkaline phosphatase D
MFGAAGLTLGTRLARSAWAQGQAPAAATSERMRPGVPYGVQSGDVTGDRAIVWSKTDRPARLIVEYATNEAFRNPRRVLGPAALAESDFTARLDLTGLPGGEEIFYRVTFQDLADTKVMSAPVSGRFRTAPTGRRTITFAWSGDEAGQGWGINPAWGGMKMYEVMRRANPDFFVHSGDQIYADGPIPAEVRLDDGSVWTNLTTPAKSKVAESLAEYRGNFAYNLLDENKRRFCAEVPMLVQWDDHEVRNNWYPGQMLGDERYSVRSASLLAAWAKRAMFEYNPYRIDPIDPERVYRSFAYGPSLDVFMLDERSYRGPNSPNRQTSLDADAAFLGPEQMRWLKRALLDSRATWKVIASDMPLSIVVPDLNPDVPKGTYEAWANAEDGAPLGRELELAGLLAFIKANGLKNVVWLTADVHYASATFYNPARAKFTDFTPFWEFVSGPSMRAPLVPARSTRPLALKSGTRASRTA